VSPGPTSLEAGRRTATGAMRSLDGILQALGRPAEGAARSGEDTVADEAAADCRFGFGKFIRRTIAS